MIYYFVINRQILIYNWIKRTRFLKVYVQAYTYINVIFIILYIKVMRFIHYSCFMYRIVTCNTTTRWTILLLGEVKWFKETKFGEISLKYQNYSSHRQMFLFILKCFISMFCTLLLVSMQKIRSKYRKQF